MEAFLPEIVYLGYARCKPKWGFQNRLERARATLKLPSVIDCSNSREPARIL